MTFMHAVCGWMAECVHMCMYIYVQLCQVVYLLNKLTQFFSQHFSSFRVSGIGSDSGLLSVYI